MEATLTIPNADLVRDACAQFDRENSVTEKALADLLAVYPANTSPSQVLVKVAALNSLYSTRILAVLKLAHYISDAGPGLDAALAAGSPQAVISIAQAGNADKDLSFYSFATKYCNWHQPNLYPVYDSRVDKYLWHLKKQDLLPSEILSYQDDLTKYAKFLQVMSGFRSHFGLGSFTFKQIDKFVWSQSEAIWAVTEEEAREHAAGLKDPPPTTEGEPAIPGVETPAETSPAPAESQILEGDAIAPPGEEVLEVYHPSDEALRGDGKLFLDMFQNAPADSGGDATSGGKP